MVQTCMWAKPCCFLIFSLAGRYLLLSEDLWMICKQQLQMNSQQTVCSIRKKSRRKQWAVEQGVSPSPLFAITERLGQKPILCFCHSLEANKSPNTTITVKPASEPEVDFRERWQMDVFTAPSAYWRTFWETKCQKVITTLAWGETWEGIPEGRERGLTVVYFWGDPGAACRTREEQPENKIWTIWSQSCLWEK